MTGETGWLERKMKVPRTYSVANSSISFTHMRCRYVLPHQHLFQLAEQPPNDLPALLNIFRTIPPVVKRRAGELLEEIRTGVSGSVDISGFRRTMAVIAQTSDTNPVRDVDQRNFHRGPGTVSIDLFFETY